MGATVKMASDNEQKLDELSRKLGVQEAELKRAVERAEMAEAKLKGIEEELETVGDNMKQLEKSAEKALEREEKLVEDLQSAEQVQDHRGQIRVRRDEHHQAEPEDRRHRGRYLQGEAEDQEVFRRAGRHLRRHDRQLLKTLSAKSDKIVSSGYDALKRPCLNHTNVKLFLNPYLECNSMCTLTKRN